MLNRSQVARPISSLALSAGDGRRLVGQLDRPLHEGLRVVADQLRQAGGAHQAAADPRGEAAARHGQQRHAHPQRVRGGGVGAVGEAVEEQVRQRIARQVEGVRRASARRSAAPARRRAARRSRPGRSIVSGSCRAATARCPARRAGSPASARRCGGVSFCTPLKLQKTKASSGRPASARVGAVRRRPPACGRSAGSRAAAPPSRCNSARSLAG